MIRYESDEYCPLIVAPNERSESGQGHILARETVLLRENSNCAHIHNVVKSGRRCDNSVGTSCWLQVLDVASSSVRILLAILLPESLDGRIMSHT